MPEPQPNPEPSSPPLRPDPATEPTDAAAPPAPPDAGPGAAPTAPPGSSSGGAPPRPDRGLRHARFAVSGYFLIAGMVLGTWASRIPAVKERTGLDEGSLSIGLLGLALGAFVAMQAAGRVADRFGSVAVLLPAAVFASVTLIGPGHASSLPVLFGALFALGAGHGMLDVPMNVEAARVERRYGRPIMASFHAAFSIGMFMGAGAGALAAYTGFGAPATFWSVALGLALVSVLLRGWLLPNTGDAAPAADATTAAASSAPGVPRATGVRRLLPRVPLAVVLFGLLACCSFLGEGAATDWATVYLHDDLDASGALAAVGFSVFSATMAGGRLVGDRLTARFGPVAIVRTGGLLAAGGLGAGLLVPSTAVAITGFGLMGAGLSCIVPQIFTATVNRDPARGGRNLGFVAGLGYLGMLSGPVVIGGIAHASNLAVALGVPAVLALVIAASAGTMRPVRGPGGGTEDHEDISDISSARV